jgi:hypothetical protein
MFAVGTNWRSSDETPGPLMIPNLTSRVPYPMKKAPNNAGAFSNEESPTSPISVNRMCQENAGAEQSHKRSCQQNTTRHPGGFIRVRRLRLISSAEKTLSAIVSFKLVEWPRVLDLSCPPLGA